MRHDNLIYILQKQFPDAVHGRDFWVAHPISQETGKQSGPAFILDWKLAEPAPTEADIAHLWGLHGEEALLHEASQNVRGQRNALLAEADVLIEHAADGGDVSYQSALKHYRQALRDLPEQAGFPNDVEWPEMPQPGSKTIFSVREFRARFTQDEQIAIRSASMTDMEVGIVYDDFQSAQFIDVHDPAVAQGIDLYVTKGLLEPGRKAELLKPEPLPEEPATDV